MGLGIVMTMVIVMVKTWMITCRCRFVFLVVEEMKTMRVIYLQHCEKHTVSSS